MTGATCKSIIHGACIISLEYKATLLNANQPSEDEDGIGDAQVEESEHDTDTAPSSMSSDITDSSTMISSSDCTSTDQTMSMTSECSTTSSLPASLPYITTSLESEVDTLGSGATACKKELQGKSLSNDHLNIGEDTAQERPGLFRYKSWSPSGEVDPDKDGKNFNRSISHEPKGKKSKERKKSLGKRFVKLFKKTKRHKKSPEQSTDEGNTAACISSGDSRHETMVTSSTAMDFYSEAAQKAGGNLSPLKVDEARRLSITDSLSSGESVTSPTSPGYESGYMSSEGMS